MTKSQQEKEKNRDFYKIEGYVNVAGRDSHVIKNDEKYSPYVECIAPGTFKKALNRGDIDLFVNVDHEEGKRCGSVKDQNLELFEDSIGCYAIAKPNKELFDRISDINKLQGWSFEFRPFEDSVVYETTCNGLPRRIIHDMELEGVSIIDTIGPVKRPYYPGTSIYHRAQEDGESVTYYWGISRNIKVKDINNELQTEKRGEECNSKTKQFFFSESEIKKIKSVQEMIEKRVKGYLKRQW